MPESTKSANELNAELLYTGWSVFAADRRLPAERGALTDEVEALLEGALAKDVYTRGLYELSGYRADADLMLWWTSPDPDLLQETYQRFRQTTLGGHLRPVWSSVGLHRPAEFNRNHIPAFVRREDPRTYVCVYPFNRSLEWYLLPDYERRGMLAEHGMMGREFEDVRANTVASFGLNDYEWLLAFEADELHRIVDCLRHLRASSARRHTRLETPFYTGARKPVADIIAALP
ncbi:chlorite dismutase family protein [Frankia sp. AgPm24]|uniref:Coproheme decarboxylase n=1 Tax=Frankia umida TaxID=573489 RepID=A0ABT0K2R7_9ACTN|nr:MULTISPECIES: hydrogen peroxide-dependent heme synthase [Frankia]MCK9878087.1 chlorite dismutase family protein [Frankia umida]MCK9924327.1 chlorite dismutase family protein [Frankia sp. AgPm24]